ncbi:hypothetical protein ELQ87_14955 [Streptomyces griseoviridis]|uniref:Uncharacterized protein n=1 Tax=Streptomyces griseoviridis TaxID=45398 RepID=A0A3Q9KW02_STRGD|nr:hypothetical protein [Streptomyces griseoviridis]AZS85453.1 hypothetical protein ELQ87_14955 [Streptomyces griseoviridis]QCN87695.1 hypothetical protein DDJ31_24340 [Streptomyces griseoviridis]
MTQLDDAAAAFTRMSLQEQEEALGALGVPKRPPKGPAGASKVTPFSALVGTPSRRKRQALTVKAVSGPEGP